MTHWAIPAKTFLLGEYAALDERGAILLTTKPVFELSLSPEPGLHGIHPDSPAGQWWSTHGPTHIGLSWQDPFNGLGGMGASSAQFVGVFRAITDLNAKNAIPLEKTISFSNFHQLLTAYWQCAWQGQGLRPSGYDVIAQSLSACVFINRRQQQVNVLPWAFTDIGFVIAHTGKKLATHHHLQQTAPLDNVALLEELVHCAHNALVTTNSAAMIESINQYHQALMTMQRVDPHTQSLINTLKNVPAIMAIKGCGAMGADVLVCIADKKNIHLVAQHLLSMNLKVLATQENLYIGARA